MQIPDEVRKCVAFVGADLGRGRQLVGTAFFVAVGPAEWHYNYAITAAHVIEGIRDAPASDGKVYLRMNTPSGWKWAVTEASQWVMHPTDPIVDVAVLAIGSLRDFDHMAYGAEGLLTPEAVLSQGIGPGEDVFLTGLFLNHFGHDRNIPIVRVGAIAAMPEEPVRTQRGPMDAFLVEARSIGGLSGSPVFVTMGLVRVVDKAVRLAGADHAPFFLLGLMHGHYDVPAVRDDSVADGLKEETVNMGIAIVAPAAKILEVLDQPALKDPRDRGIAEHAASSLPVPDGLPTGLQRPS